MTISKHICDICGVEHDDYGLDKYSNRTTDSITIKVYDIKTKRFNIKHYWTCRDCACMIRAYADRRAQELKGE